MAEPEIVFTPHADEALVRLVNDGVDLHNIAATGLAEWCPANFFLKGLRGDWLGGVTGVIWGGFLHVRYLWVTESARGKGQGRRLLQAAEDYARERGCSGATLETFSFQAPDFYQRQGYRVVGRIDGFPPGHTKFFLRKDLV